MNDLIKFGKYPYHEDGSKEPIEWQVLDKKKDRILVISKYGLDEKQYHEKFEDVTWETCTLRKWLNHDFMDAAFTEKEKGQILLSHVPADLNPKYDTNPGNDTDDYIFLLSVKEAKKRKYFQNNGKRKAYVTPWLFEKYMHFYKECDWWLRSPGVRGDLVGSVSGRSLTCIRDWSGSISYSGDASNSRDLAVRPAMWLMIND